MKRIYVFFLEVISGGYEKIIIIDKSKKKT